MGFIESSKVKVFPSALRGSDGGEYADGKFTSENNLTNMIKSVTDMDSFIISWEDNILKLVLHGYYFEVNVEKGKSLNAYCWVDEYNMLATADGSQSFDTNNEFKGLSIGTTSSKATEPTKLLSEYSLELTDSNGNILPQSLLKFKDDFILHKINEIKTDGDSGEVTTYEYESVNSAIEKKQNKNETIDGSLVNTATLGTVTKAKTLVYSNDTDDIAYNVGNDNKFIYFKDGIPVESTFGPNDSTKTELVAINSNGLMSIPDTTTLNYNVMSADRSEKATYDGNDNNIAETYQTKIDGGVKNIGDGNTIMYLKEGVLTAGVKILTGDSLPPFKSVDYPEGYPKGTIYIVFGEVVQTETSNETTDEATE